MNKTILATAAVMGFLAVILGAMGAHALESSLSEDALQSFKTGVQYQMIHALFLLFLGVQSTLGVKAQKRIFLLILSGVICFSFSIYGLSTESLTGIDFSPVAWVTPIGGLLLLLGWAMLFYRVIRS